MDGDEKIMMVGGGSSGEGVNNRLVLTSVDDDGDYFRSISSLQKKKKEEQHQRQKKVQESQEEEQKYQIYKRIIPPETTSSSSSSSSFTEDQTHETAIIISTHLIPSHPSLNTLLETIDSLKHIEGLPPKSQLILTVDGLNDNTAKNRQTYFLLRSNNNHHKLKLYIKALKHEFIQKDNYFNVQIMASNHHRGLGHILHDAIDTLLHPNTKYAYILQQDLPFIRPINHTAILQTAYDHPNKLHIVRFNTRSNEIMDREKVPCWNQTEPFQSIHNIHLHKTPLWSDRNHWVNLTYWKTVIQPNIDLNTFPEVKMSKLAWVDCRMYGPYMYGLPGEKEYVKHTDGSERYGKKIKARIERGDVKKEDLKEKTIREEKIEI